jgi:hypothetical protein
MVQFRVNWQISASSGKLCCYVEHPCAYFDRWTTQIRFKLIVLGRADYLECWSLEMATA